MEDNQKRDKEKQAILDKILKEGETGVRVLPSSGYSHKLQTIRSNKVTA